MKKKEIKALPNISQKNKIEYFQTYLLFFIKMKSSIYGIRLPPLVEKGDSLYSKKKNKENKKKKNLLKYIDNLPDELQRYIFDYIKIELWYQQFHQSLTSNMSQSLNICEIRPWIPRILSNPYFTKLCIEKDPSFEIIWRESKKNNQKYFKNLKKGDSFALALLFYHYH